MIQSLLFRGLVDHLWQSTLFVGAAWLLTLALRKNRAQVRYWVWFSASVKFLAPLALLVAVGELAPKRAAVPMVRTEWVATVDQIAEPSVALPAVTVSMERTSRNYFVPVALAAWACGFLSVAICWLRRWRRVHALRRSATPISGTEFAVPVMSVPGLVEPGVFGVFQPLLLLPGGITERLTPAQLDAILAHELCHVRRKDNLTATIHMIVQAAFWFHPLVWWLGARLIDERERACDEEVVRLGSKPQVYAEGILNICKLYVESPLKCVSGVTGSNLKRRIEAIMKNRMVLRLNFGKKLVLAVAGMVALAVPIAVGILHAQPAPTRKWEAASIRPCEPGGGRSGGPRLSPGRLNTNCQTVMTLIQQAYVTFANGQFQAPWSVPISGGPAWVNSARYEIEAKAEGEPLPHMMEGPMMQALLEDRFRLKVHRETKEVPVYALTVAKGGFKLHPFKEGSCTPRDPEKGPVPLEPGQKPYCGSLAAGGPGLYGVRVSIAEPSIWTLNLAATSMSVFCSNLRLDRPILDKTGITGLFDFHLEYAFDQVTAAGFPGVPAPAAAPPDPGSAPSIFTAIQEQLGLKLEPAKGPGEFLVVDSVERPSEN